MDKYQDEFNRLLKRYARIVALLNVMDADINIRREIERDNDLPFVMRSSIQVEEARGKWQRELAKTKQDIFGIVQIMIKHKNE